MFCAALTNDLFEKLMPIRYIYRSSYHSNPRNVECHGATNGIKYCNNQRKTKICYNYIINEDELSTLKPARYRVNSSLNFLY